MVDNAPDAFDETTIEQYFQVTDAGYENAVDSADYSSLADFAPWFLSNPTAAVPFSTIIFHILVRRRRECQTRLVLEALKPIHLDHPDLVYQLEESIDDFHYKEDGLDFNDRAIVKMFFQLCAKATVGLISSCLWRHPRDLQTIPEPSRTVKKSDHPAAAA